MSQNFDPYTHTCGCFLRRLRKQSRKCLRILAHLLENGTCGHNVFIFYGLFQFVLLRNSLLMKFYTITLNLYRHM